MHRPRPFSFPIPRRGSLGVITAWYAGVWFLASACGPGVATPMPEPPTVFDLNAVGAPQGVVSVAGKETDSKTISVYRNRLPANSTVRVTNLDRMDATVAADVPQSQDANLIISVIDGEELRFEAITPELRSQPADAIFVLDDALSGAFHLAPSERFACLKLEPGYRLDVGDAIQVTLSLENDCESAITLGNARSRLALPDFVLESALPLEVAAAASAELTVNFTRAAAGVREDVLFIDVTLDGATIRYPITLRAE